jgi:hypothetical protein
MNYKTDGNNNAKSITMELENLQQMYSNLLIKYKQSVTDYITNLNVKDKEKFVRIKGMAYTGTGTAGQSRSNTLQSCQASCASNPKCTGATFVAGKCNIRTGDSPIVPSKNDSYAIVPKSKQLLMNMEKLNEQLLNVNRRITDKIKLGEPIYYKSESENDIKTHELIENYKKLQVERNNIQKMIQDYETLDSTKYEHDISITKNYYTYILSFILVVIFIIILVKMSISDTTSSTTVVQYGGQLGISAYYFLFGIILLAVGLNLVIKYK